MSEKTTNKEKLFTRDELEIIVEQRLARERKNKESLKKIRRALTEFRKKEPFKSLSNAELADLFVNMSNKSASVENTAQNVQSTVVPDNDKTDIQAENTEMKEQTQNAEQGLENNDTSSNTKEETILENELPLQSNPSQNQTLKEIPGENNSSNEASSQKNLSDNFENEQKARRISEISEFFVRHGEKAFGEAMSDNAFKAFCVGKSGTLSTLYESYKEFLSALSQSPEARKYRELKNGLASTGFSESSSPNIDYGSMLTENQRQIAASSGMSYQQYAELLSQIPAKKINSKK